MPTMIRHRWRRCGCGWPGMAMIDGHPMRGRGRGGQGGRAGPHGGRQHHRGDGPRGQGPGRPVARSAGLPRTLDRALSLPQPALDGLPHLTPRYLAARFAVYDDQLEEARDDLFKMLALAERGGGEEFIGVLRCLAEVSAHSGRCRDALDFAGRAIRVTQEAGLSPGPAWQIEPSPNSLAALCARRDGLRPTRSERFRAERDSIFLGRNLHASVRPGRRAGDARRWSAHTPPDPGVGTGAEGGRAVGAALAAAISPPGWSPSANWTRPRNGLIRLGRRASSTRTHNAGVTSRLDRAEALLREPSAR